MKRLLIDYKGNRYLIDEGRDIHTKYGVVKKEDLAKVKHSGAVKSHLGKDFFVVEPTVVDYVEEMRKPAQVVYPKDSSMIIGLTGIGSGSLVVEAGVGVAGLTMALANAVRPEGKVVSYEIREDHINAASKNLAAMGLSKYSEIKNKSIYDGIDEQNVDMIVLDLGEPWLAIGHALKALKVGGHLVSYSPSVEQVKKFVLALPKDFREVRTIEFILREWEVSSERMRPNTRMIGHTGFLTFARKVC